MTVKTPAYDLNSIKSSIKSIDELRMTGSARVTMVELGFHEQDVINVIKAMTPRDFYKSMEPTKPGFKKWQDVYRPLYKGVELYMKFQLGQLGHIVISFKEK